MCEQGRFVCVISASCITNCIKFLYFGGIFQGFAVVFTEMKFPCTNTPIFVFEHLEFAFPTPDLSTQH